LDDRVRIEIGGVDCEAGAGAVLDALIDGQDAYVAAAPEPAVAENLLEATQRRVAAIALREHAVDEVGTGQVQLRLVDRFAAVAEQAVGLVAEQLFDPVQSRVTSRNSH